MKVKLLVRYQKIIVNGKVINWKETEDKTTKQLIGTGKKKVRVNNKTKKNDRINKNKHILKIYTWNIVERC